MIKQMGNEGYREEFEEIVDISDFYSWIENSVCGFMDNLKDQEDKPLHQWITLFLLWSEYQDYKDIHG